MSPRLIEGDECPHCGEELPQPMKRNCARCGGSLQQRYLTFGCLSSAPPVILLAVGIWYLARAL